MFEYSLGQVKLGVGDYLDNSMRMVLSPRSLLNSHSFLRIESGEGGFSIG